MCTELVKHEVTYYERNYSKEQGQSYTKIQLFDDMTPSIRRDPNQRQNMDKYFDCGKSIGFMQNFRFNSQRKLMKPGHKAKDVIPLVQLIKYRYDAFVKRDVLSF